MRWRGARDIGTASFDFVEDTNQAFTQYIYRHPGPDSLTAQYTSGGLIWEFTFGLEGDFDRDGLLTATDIDMLTGELIMGNHPPGYDLNKDKLVNELDHEMWVHERKNTWYGDADLNGEFNSSDFVQVFQVGKYETEQPAGWSEGDWNGDGVFDTSDFVTAFQDGGYELGPKMDAAAVPEPGGWLLLAMGLSPVLFGRRIRRSV
jgi:hypothetical protein